MEPVYRIIRDEPGVRRVERVEKLRLLSPSEREEARRQREEKRREVQERSARKPPKKSPQESREGTDYYG